MEAEEIIRTEHLTYEYQAGCPVLQDLSVSIHKGEKIAVMGSNGAGKSTFFLHLNGVLQAGKGKIFYGGAEIRRKDLNGLRKHVGFVFQDADNQMIASSVQAEVAFGPMNLKLPKEEVKKRVSIADIIAMKPEVILFDEPTAALDPLGGELLEDVLERLSKEGKTLLVSTHDVDFAYRWAERALIFHQGKLAADGGTLEIFQQEQVLRETHLKKPEMLTVYEALLQKGRIRKGSYPRRAGELPGALI